MTEPFIATVLTAYSGTQSEKFNVGPTAKGHVHQSTLNLSSGSAIAATRRTTVLLSIHRETVGQNFGKSSFHEAQRYFEMTMRGVSV